MKIEFNKSSHFNWKYFLLKDKFHIRKYWEGKIINIGFWSIYITIDIRKDWVSDMTFGQVTMKDIRGL